MRKPALKPLRDERGMSLIFVGIGLAAFVAATMLAIDVGMLMTARTQAQNSADAGAHAGAVALAFDDFADRTSTGPAVTNAVREAHANKVMDADVSADPPDVEFLNDPDGRPNRVKITVYRTGARGNPLDLIIARIFGINTADIAATATAEASNADMPDRCFPFTIPDKWDERTTPPYNSETSTFQLFDPSRNPLPRPDVYIPANESGYTGYKPDIDKGSLVILKASGSTNVSPSEYNPITIPGNGTGADPYRSAILAGPCANFEWRTLMVPEPGNMVGPTKMGVDDLIALDPNVTWNPVKECVSRTAGNCDGMDSRRVGAIPLYDPDYYERGKQTGRFADFRVANYLGVFIEGMRGNDVLARIVPIAGHRSGRTDMPEGMFMRSIRIVQ